MEENSYISYLTQPQDSIVADAIPLRPEGFPLPDIRFSIDIIAICAILYIVTGAIVLSRMLARNGNIKDNIKGYLTGQRNFSFSWDLAVCYFSLSGIGGFSMLVIAWMYRYGITPDIFATVAAIAVCFVAKAVASQCYVKVFFSTVACSMLRLQALFFSGEGFIALLACIVAAYSPTDGITAVVIVTCVLLTIGAVLLYIAVYAIFFNNVKLLFEYILYLCALEILPLAVSVRLLRQVQM